MKSINRPTSGLNYFFMSDKELKDFLSNAHRLCFNSTLRLVSELFDEEQKGKLLLLLLP